MEATAPARVGDLKPPNPDWKTYRAGEGDRAGRKIDKVYAMGDDYVIYFSDCELFYEIGDDVSVNLGNADVALARINRLLPSGSPVVDRTREYKYSTLELVADAYEMIFCGEVSEGLTILNDIRDKLQTAAEGTRRLFYQLGAVSMAVAGWAMYLFLRHTETMPRGWEPWMLAAALAMAGGAFSVCLNLGSLQVSVNQRPMFLFAAGATRSVVALLAGIGLLLAMRARMLAGFAYQATNAPPAASAGLLTVEMFFCFLAGFSETFVPNILRDSEKNPGGTGAKSAEQAKTVEQAKAAEQAKANPDTKTNETPKKPAGG